MPDAEIKRRGGAMRVRTISLPGGKYRRIYIVRKAGPHGGKTVAGEMQTKERK
jgi:hypothetical protein